MSVHTLAWLVALSSIAVPASAQVPACDGDDSAGASEAFEAGNALLTQATAEARARHRDRARELAAEALTHFDRQCELGDDSALAERGAALMLMGEALRSAQSYDAYLARHPLGSLDARTRRRIEPNLQPGQLEIERRGEVDAHVLVDGLDFGPVQREEAIRLPFGSYDVEVRTPDGSVLVSMPLALSSETPVGHLTVAPAEVSHGPTRIDTPPDEHPDEAHDRGPAGPSARTDYTLGYVITGAAAGVFLVVGIGLQLWADERAQTYNRVCRSGGMTVGCDAVLAEYDGLFGGAIASYVLAGLAAVGLGVVAVLDLTQPSGPSEPAVACAPSIGDRAGGVLCAGRF
jgi:hypothetical protein